MWISVLSVPQEGLTIVVRGRHRSTCFEVDKWSSTRTRVSSRSSLLLCVGSRSRTQAPLANNSSDSSEITTTISRLTTGSSHSFIFIWLGEGPSQVRGYPALYSEALSELQSAAQAYGSWLDGIHGQGMEDGITEFTYVLLFVS